MDLRHSQIRINKCNILTAIRLSIKSLCDRGCFTTLDDQTPEVVNFCFLLENIFYLCLKENGIFQSTSRKHPWDLISAVVSKMGRNSIASIQSMENLKNKFAKLRGWIRLSMLEKKLYQYVNFLYQNQPLLREYYSDESPFLSRDNQAVLQMLFDVSELDIGFDLKGTDLNYPDVVPIDYTPYMRFIQSRDLSEVDADNSVSIRCSGHEAVDEEKCPWKLQYTIIDQKLQSALTSKEYFEHLIQDKERDIAELLRENADMAGQLQKSETERNNLKMNVTLVHEEYRTAVQYLGGDPDHLPTPTNRILNQPPPSVPDDS